MGKETGIAWTDHTFNSWFGCTKVSPGCTNCYAEAQTLRSGHAVWGPQAERKHFDQKHWNKPLHWDAEAKKAGVRRRVFCASMSDVFELRSDLDEDRAKLWNLISKTPNLDWLLLTKRPQLVSSIVPSDWMTHRWPGNVWIGTTVEDQLRADGRIKELIRLPAPVRFISCEPLLMEVTLPYLYAIDWVIVGGESGPAARPFHLNWARKIRDACAKEGAAFFMKQTGENPTFDESDPKPLTGLFGTRHVERAGAIPDVWPEDLQVRNWPEPKLRVPGDALPPIGRDHWQTEPAL